ncbi:MAG: tetratricopeptide repeat protein [Candidatus Hodarchaeales archaeon]|jgi:tetratricopeptide (TPR) repeat protein
MFNNEENLGDYNKHLSFIPQEFRNHIIKLQPTTIKLLKRNFKENFDRFYERLEKIYFNWPGGFLDPEFLYLLIKVGVLTGHSKRLLRIKEDLKAFNDHPGIYSWFSGIFFKEGPDKVHSAHFYLNHIDENKFKNDKNLFTEIVAWKIAFIEDLNVSIGLFEDSKAMFTWELPYYIIVEKLMRIKRLKLAENYVDQGIRFAKKNRLIQGRLLNAKGVIARIKGDPLKSMDWFILALDEIQPINGFTDVYLKSFIYFNMGTSVLRLRAYQEAENYFCNVLKIQESEGIDDCMSQSSVHYNLSNLFIRQGFYKKALKNLTLAEEIKRKEDPLFKKSVTISTLSRKAIIYRYLGDYINSRRILFEVIEKFESLGRNYNPIALTEAKLNLIEVKNLMGEEVLADLQDLIHFCSNFDYIIGVYRVLNLMSEIYLKKGNISASEDMLNEMKAIASNITDEKRKLDIYMLEAKTQFVKGNIYESEAILMSIFETSQEKEIKIKCGYYLGQIYLYRRELVKSNGFFQLILNLFESKTNDYYFCEFMSIKTQILLEKMEVDFNDLIENIINKIEKLDDVHANLHSKTVKTEYSLLKAWMYMELSDYQSAQNIYYNLDVNSHNDFRTICLISIGSIKCEIFKMVHFDQELDISADLIKKVQELIIRVKKSSYYFFSIEVRILEIYLSMCLKLNGETEYKVKSLKEELIKKGLVLYLSDINKIEDILNLENKQKEVLIKDLTSNNEISQILYTELVI